jgi:hypothetical protein
MNVILDCLHYLPDAIIIVLLTFVVTDEYGNFMLAVVFPFVIIIKNVHFGRCDIGVCLQARLLDVFPRER